MKDEQILLDTSDEEFRNTYKKLIDEKNKNLDNKLKRLRIDLIQLKA